MEENKNNIPVDLTQIAENTELETTNNSTDVYVKTCVWKNIPSDGQVIQFSTLDTINKDDDAPESTSNSMDSLRIPDPANESDTMEQDNVRNIMIQVDLQKNAEDTARTGKDETSISAEDTSAKVIDNANKETSKITHQELRPQESLIQTAQETKFVAVENICKELEQKLVNQLSEHSESILQEKVDKSTSAENDNETLLQSSEKDHLKSVDKSVHSEALKNLAAIAPQCSTASENNEIDPATSETQSAPCLKIATYVKNAEAPDLYPKANKMDLNVTAVNYSEEDLNRLLAWCYKLGSIVPSRDLIADMQKLKTIIYPNAKFNKAVLRISKLPKSIIGDHVYMTIKKCLMPYVHLAKKIKHIHLDTQTEKGFNTAYVKWNDYDYLDVVKAYTVLMSKNFGVDERREFFYYDDRSYIKWDEKDNPIISDKPRVIQKPTVIQEPKVIQEPTVIQEPKVIQGPKAIQEPKVIQEPEAISKDVPNGNVNKEPIEDTETTANASDLETNDLTELSNIPSANEYKKKLKGIPPFAEGGMDLNDLEIYGFNDQYLAGLNIKPPLSKEVHVTNLHLDLDVAAIRNIFSEAGIVHTIKLFVSEVQNSAKVEYDHPIEAVQAISMFDNETVRGRVIKVSFFRPNKDRQHSAKSRSRFENFGFGIGPNGTPLYDIRTTIELKKIKRTLLKKLSTLKAKVDALKSRTHEEQNKIVNKKQKAAKNGPAIQTNNQIQLSAMIANAVQSSLLSMLNIQPSALQSTVQSLPNQDSAPTCTTDAAKENFWAPNMQPYSMQQTNIQPPANTSPVPAMAAVNMQPAGNKQPSANMQPKENLVPSADISMNLQSTVNIPQTMHMAAPNEYGYMANPPQIVYMQPYPDIPQTMYTMPPLNIHETINIPPVPIIPTPMNPNMQPEPYIHMPMYPNIQPEPPKQTPVYPNMHFEPHIQTHFYSNMQPEPHISTPVYPNLLPQPYIQMSVYPNMPPTNQLPPSVYPNMQPESHMQTLVYPNMQPGPCLQTPVYPNMPPTNQPPPPVYPNMQPEPRMQTPVYPNMPPTNQPPPPVHPNMQFELRMQTPVYPNMPPTNQPPPPVHPNMQFEPRMQTPVYPNMPPTNQPPPPVNPNMQPEPRMQTPVYPNMPPTNQPPPPVHPNMQFEPRMQTPVYPNMPPTNQPPPPVNPNMQPEPRMQTPVYPNMPPTNQPPPPVYPNMQPEPRMQTPVYPNMPPTNQPPPPVHPNMQFEPRMQTPVYPNMPPTNQPLPPTDNIISDILRRTAQHIETQCGYKPVAAKSGTSISSQSLKKPVLVQKPAYTSNSTPMAGDKLGSKTGVDQMCMTPEAKKRSHERYQSQKSSRDRDSKEREHKRMKSGERDYESSPFAVTFKCLPPNATTQYLKEQMQQIGHVVDVTCSGTPGRAVVEFRRREDAETCIQMYHLSKLDGQTIEATLPLANQ